MARDFLDAAAERAMREAAEAAAAKKTSPQKPRLNYRPKNGRRSRRARFKTKLVAMKCQE